MENVDGQLVVAALPKVLALIHSEHVKEAREGLKALRLVAESTPELFHGAGDTLAALLEAAVGGQQHLRQRAEKEDVARECAMTLVAVAGAVATGPTGARASEKILLEAIDLFMRLATTPREEKERLLSLAFTLQSFLESPRLWVLCPSSKRHDLICSALSSMRGARRSEVIKAFTALITAATRRETAIADRGLGVRLARIMEGLIESVVGVECAAGLTDALNEICLRDVENGLPCLRAFFTSSLVREKLHELGQGESRDPQTFRLFARLSVCLANICEDESGQVDLATWIFSLSILREYYLPLMTIFAECQQISESFAKVMSHSPSAVRSGAADNDQTRGLIAEAGKLEAALWSTIAALRHLPLLHSAKALVCFGSCANADTLIWSARVSDEYRERCAEVLDKASVKLEASELSHVVIELARVMCNVCQSDIPSHLIASSVRKAVEFDQNCLDAGISVLMCLQVPRTPHDAAQMLSVADMMMREAQKSCDTYPLMVASKLMAKLVATEMDDIRSQVQKRMRSDLRWIFQVIESSNRPTTDDITTVLGNFVCASSLCPSQKSGKCFGTCAWEFWNEVFDNVSAHPAEPANRGACVYVGAVGKLAAHAPVSSLSTLGPLTLTTLEALWSDYACMRNAAAQSADRILAIATKIPYQQVGKGSILSGEESLEPFSSERQSVVWAFMHHLKSRSEQINRTPLVFALRSICNASGSGDLWAIALDLLVSEVIAELKNPACTNMEAYEALVDVSRASSHKQRSAAAVSETVRGAFDTLLPLLFSQNLDKGTIVELATLADMDTEDLWSELPRHVLPRLFRSDDLLSIQRLADDSQSTVAELVSSLLPEITSRCLLSRGSRGRILLEKTTGRTVQSIVHEHESDVIRLLIMELGGSRSAMVEKALTEIAGSQSKVSDLLSLHFLRVMDELNKLLFGKKSARKRKKGQDCLQGFLSLTARSVHLFIPKIMATLKLAVEDEDENLKAGALSAWSTFLDCLSPKQAEPHVVSFLSLVLPHLRAEDTHLLKSISRTVLSCAPELGQQLFEVLMLLEEFPDPILDELRDRVREVSPGHDMSIQALLAAATEHESNVIRRIAVRRLHSLLVQQRRTLLSSPLLSSLSERLTAALRHPNVQYRTECLKCLAEIGAPDPSEICRSMHSQKADPRDHYTSTDAVQLSAHLLNSYLVPALRRGELKGGGDRQNQAGFSIQELLRLRGCTPATPDTAHRVAPSEADALHLDDQDTQVEDMNAVGVSFWLSLTEEVRASVKPYLVQNFVSTFSGLSRDPSQRQRNDQFLLNSLHERLQVHRAGMSTFNWLKEFTARVIDALGSSNDMSRVLIASRIVVRNDHETALFCLPFALSLLIQGPNLLDAAKSIATELLTVINNDDAVQVVFYVLDSLQRMRANLSLPKGIASKLRERKDNRLDPLLPTSSVSLLAPTKLAVAARKVGAWSRVVLYVEEGLRTENSSQSREKDLRWLQEAYNHLEEVDELVGIATMLGGTTLEEKVMEANSTGNYDDELLLYEQLLAENADDLEMHRGYLRCMRPLGHWEMMLSHTENLLRHHKDSTIASVGTEAAWRLCRWDNLEKLDKTGFNSILRSWEDEFERELGKAFLCFQKNDGTQFRRAISAAREAILEPLASVSLDGYKQASTLIGRAYPLSIISDAFEKRNDADSVLLAELGDRVDAMVPSFRVREPVLASRITTLQLLGNTRAAGLVCVELAKNARRFGNLRAALGAATRAQALGVADGTVEVAKLMYLSGGKLAAISLLVKEINQAKKSMSRKTGEQAEAKRISWLHLRVGRWMEETKSSTPSEILLNYRQATDLAPDAGKPAYVLGRYFDVLLAETQSSPGVKPGAYLPTGARAQPMVPAEPSANEGTALSAFEYLPLILENWTNALRISRRYVHQVLPRILTLWFDFGTAATGSGKDAPSHGLQKKVTLCFNHLINVLPKAIWLTALPQLLSRLLHPNESIQNTIVSLLASVVASFPDQALWFVVPVTRSREANRSSRAKRIVQKAIANAKDEYVAGVLSAGSSLVKELIRVCIQPAPQKVRTVRASVNLKSLLRLLPSMVAIPTHATLSSVPDGDDAGGFVTFTSIEEEVMLMPSLMKPKRVGFIGSDGNRYIFLCKREDSGDMRKDSRLMEFANAVNLLLAKDTEARQRMLSLQTYEVLPLNEECGLVEWVDHLVSLRSAYNTIFKMRGLTTTFQEVMRLKEKKTCSDVEFFEQDILPRFPPLLHAFFLFKFPDPIAWLDARRRFTRSVAVWSITGYIVGLGDRHGENVTIEMKTGTCVHVDFACMFDKGLTLKVPEVVPFRLTRNLADAMGIHGHEGSFRRVAEITLRILRSNREALMSVLETFLHDPLVEWNHIGKAKNSGGEGGDNAYAVRTLSAVDQKLRGIVGAGLPLSIEGQVQRLIHEATTTENLSKMYTGWMAWI